MQRKGPPSTTVGYALAGAGAVSGFAAGLPWWAALAGFWLGGAVLTLGIAAWRAAARGPGASRRCPCSGQDPDGMP